MQAIFWLIDTVLDLFIFALIANVILSWLVAFNIINSYQPFVASVGQFLNVITEPVLRPIRSILPATGGIDLSPLIALLLVQFLKIFIATSVRPALL